MSWRVITLRTRAREAKAVLGLVTQTYLLIGQVVLIELNGRSALPLLLGVPRGLLEPSPHVTLGLSSISKDKKLGVIRNAIGNPHQIVVIHSAPHVTSSLFLS